MVLNATVITIRTATIVAPALFALMVAASIRSLLNAHKRPLQAIAVPVVSTVLIFNILAHLPALVEDLLNTARLPYPPIHLQNVQKHPFPYHVADLHCDTLLWGARDFLKTTYHPIATNRPIGAVDVPRMRKGRISLQVFAAVNAVPRTLNFQYNERPSHPLADALVLKTVLERWPIKTWLSPKQRVLYQFQRLKQAAAENSQALQITLSKRQLRDSGKTTQPIRAIMAIEGLSCLNHDISTVDEFFQAGVRILGPTHFFDTEMGGSRSGACQCGITDFGRDVLRRMKNLGMIVDLAHASDPFITDVLDMTPEESKITALRMEIIPTSHKTYLTSKYPSIPFPFLSYKGPYLMISHTGVNAICPSARNLGDELIIRIAEAGGLVGIALFEPALCGDDVIQSFVDSVRHVSKITGGVRSVAIGSDWDGNVHTPVSAADTPVLSASLVEIGNFSHGDVKRIMCDNAFDFFMKSLPE